MKKFCLAVALAAGLATAVQAGAPIQLSLAGPYAQIVGQEREITGLKLNLIYGDNDCVSGLDLGLVSRVGDFSGVRLNAINLSDVRCAGVEFGVLNLDTGNVTGLQVGGFNRAGEMRGLQLGLANYCDRLRGVQIGLLNIVGHANAWMIPFVNWKF